MENNKLLNKESLWEKYRVEIITAVVSFIISNILPFFGVPWFVAIIADVLSVLLLLNVIRTRESLAELIHVSLEEFKNEGKAATIPIITAISEISPTNTDVLDAISVVRKQTDALHAAHHLLLNMVNLDDSHEIYAKEVIKDASHKVKLISEDRIPLSEDAFFDMLFREFKNLKSGTKTLAVNAFETTRWVVDPRERLYFEENRKASERGASIERIFILSRFPANSEDAESRAKVLQRHIEIGVDVFVVYRDVLGRRNELVKDVVMFEGEKPRLYEDFQDQVDPTRILDGELHLSKESHDDFFKHYSQLKEYAISENELKALLEKYAS